MKLYLPKIFWSAELVFLMLLLNGCVAQRQYRVGRSPFVSSDPSVQTNRSMLESGPLYQLGFIEFDDQGVLWSRGDTAFVLDRLHHAVMEQKESGVIMLTFVHGWKHSAAPNDDNVGLFRNILQGISIMEASLAENEGRRARKVIGTYIGWRGYSITSQLGLWNLTIFDRKKTAETIGSRGAVEVLARIESIRNDQKERERKASVSPSFAPTRLITIGHSLGGTLLYNAIQQVLNERLASAGVLTGKLAASNEVVVRGYGDLTLLINPAFEAMQFSPIYDALVDISDFAPAQRPFLAFLTSETDMATRVLFPWSRTPRIFSDRYRRREESKTILDERNADRVAIGHYRPFVSHRLSLIDGDFGAIAERESFRDWIGGQSSLQVIRLPRFDGTLPTNSLKFLGVQPSPLKRSPLLNIAVSPAIIAGHSIPSPGTPAYDALADAVAGLIRLNDYPVDEESQRRRDESTRLMQATMGRLLQR